MVDSRLYRFGRALVLAAVAVLLTAGSAFAQAGRVEGTVRHAVTGDPIENARVVVEGTSLAAVTNSSGFYAVDNVPTGVHTIRTQVIGFQTVVITNQGVRPGVPTTVNIDLQPSVLRIEGVVVTGVVEGTTGVKLPFTVDRVTSSDIPVMPTGTPEEAIRGKIAGAKVIRANGEPGGGVSVLLRGATSIDVQGRSNEPLYVVDGVILGASMVDVDALNISSIEVLKGAAASSLYGARAANGVVAITTNRGRNLQQNETRIVARSEAGANYIGSSVPRTEHHEYLVDTAGSCQVPISVVPGETQMKAGTCWLDDTGAAVTRFNRVLDNPFGQGGFQDNPYGGQLFDHLDLFFDPGTFQTHSLTVAHRTGTTNFATSFSSTQESGVIAGLDGFERKSLRLNLDHSISDNIELSASGYYANSTSDGNPGEPDDNTPNPMFGLMFLERDSDLLAPNADGEPFVIQPDARAVEENPLYAINNRKFEKRRSRTLGNFRLRWFPVEGFDFEGDFSFDRSTRNRFEFYKKGFKTLGSSQLNNGRIDKANDFDQAINASATARYAYEFGDVNARTAVRVLLERSEFENIFASARNLIVNQVDDLDVGTQADNIIGSVSQDVRSLGYFLTQDFDFKDRYIISGVVRRDGSSLFGQDERWHTYYRIGGAYRVAQESWWPVDVIDEFKLRYSRGTAGGRPRFSAQFETFAVSGGQVSKETLGNTELKPEFATENEYGLDMIFGGKVQASVTYAQSVVQDQILLVPLPGFFGFEDQWQNAGTLRSRTWEASLQANIIATPTVGLDVNVVFDRTRQRITEFTPPPFIWGQEKSVFYNREGEEFGTMYGARWMTSCSQLPTGATCGAWDVNDDGYLVPVGSGNSATDGISGSLWGTTVTDGGVGYNWGRPVKQDSVLPDGSSTTFLAIGATTPDFNVGFSQTLRFKNFSFYTLFDAQIGGDVYNGTKQWSFRDSRHGENDQFGKAEGDKKPGFYYQDLYNTNGSSAHFVEDGTYLKFRELNLRYTFNQSALSNVFGGFMNRIALSVVGRNLVTWTDYTGFDPEVGGGRRGNAAIERTDQFDYPNYKTFTGSIEIEF